MVLCANTSTNRPWKPNLSALILLQKCKSPIDVNQLHAKMITTGSLNDNALSASIVRGFISSPHKPLAEFARRVFFTRRRASSRRRRRQENDDAFLWNVVIKSYSHGCDPRQALVTFCLMLENGVSVDKFSFSLVLKACGRLGLRHEGSQVHGLLEKTGIGSDLYLQNSLISLYLRCGSVEFAVQVFDKMPQRDSVSYNSMIDGYVKSGMVDLARRLFDSMPTGQKNLVTWNSMIGGYVISKNGLGSARDLFETMPERDTVSWNTMMNGCVRFGELENARELFERMPERDTVSWANLIDGYSKSGSVEVARILFDAMPERDAVACNAMMTGYVTNGYFAEALEIFRCMRRTGRGVAPDATTLSIALSAAARLGEVGRGSDVRRYADENGLSSAGRIGAALIDMYAKCGSIEEAAAVFDGIEEKSVDHWNAMIGGLASHGLGESAFLMLMEMERLRVEPDDITFIGVLSACGHRGLVKEGLMCFELMRRVHGVEPKLQHYGCVVDILGRAGRVEEARRLVDEMPIEPNDVIWRTLLSACGNHERLEIGEPIAMYLIERDSRNPSLYVILSNMYAGLGMWDEVRKVRTMMRERRVEKRPGCSMIELGGCVHEFLVRDSSHPRVGEIYSVLDGLWPTISEAVAV